MPHFRRRRFFRRVDWVSRLMVIDTSQICRCSKTPADAVKSSSIVTRKTRVVRFIWSPATKNDGPESAAVGGILCQLDRWKPVGER